MTYNVRYGTADDGPNAWPLRRDLALRVIANERPDVIGVGRDDGAEAGEYAAILYDRRRVEPLDSGTFWLSDTPEVVASIGWGNRITRIVTWARFRDRRSGARFRDRRSGARFYVFNTHWDHESQPSREKSATLLVRRIAARAQASDPVVVTGDFNAGSSNPARVTLAEASLEDTFRALHPAAVEVGTFHGFEGDRSGEKIDAVLASQGWRILEAWIVTLNDSGRYPSDHFPVMAVVEPE